MRQGNDVGTQYRSGFYYFDDDQKQLIEVRRLVRVRVRLRVRLTVRVRVMSHSRAHELSSRKELSSRACHLTSFDLTSLPPIFRKTNLLYSLPGEQGCVREGARQADHHRDRRCLGLRPVRRALVSQ